MGGRAGESAATTSLRAVVCGAAVCVAAAGRTVVSVDGVLALAGSLSVSRRLKAALLFCAAAGSAASPIAKVNAAARAGSK